MFQQLFYDELIVKARGRPVKKIVFAFSILFFVEMLEKGKGCDANHQPGCDIIRQTHNQMCKEVKG